MKVYFIMVSIFTVLLILVPMVVYVAFPADVKNDTSDEKSFILGYSTQADETTTEVEVSQTSVTPCDSFNILDTTTNEVMVVSAKDYVVGAVCAEMPPSFEPEALKAQAVVAYTYALRLKQSQESNPTQALHGADFSNDSTQYQAYLTSQQIQDYYGSNYAEYYDKVSTAVDDVLGQTITYHGNLIVPIYHAISSGTTEDALNVWGYSIPYLTPVDSSQDTTAPDYLATITLTPTELKSKFSTAYPEVTFSNDCTSWVSVQSTTDVGNVISVIVGSISITGAEFSDVLGLCSNDFEVSYNGDTFDITTRGSGHGVGMSQYGANQMALDGSSYVEILQHYYTGVDIN